MGRLVSRPGRIYLTPPLLLCKVPLVSISLSTGSTVCSKLPTVTYVLPTLPYSTYLLPRREGEEDGESGERSNDHDNKTTKQQTTTTTLTSRYLLPFLRITVSVAWYIYLTVLRCICIMQCRSKKNHQSINKLLYHTLHLHVPSPTRSPYLTSPYIQFSPYPYLPNNTFPYPHSLTHSL